MGFFAKEYTPLYRGFDTHFGPYQGKGDYYDHISDNGGDTRGYDFHDQEEHVAQEYAGRYATELYAERAQRIITEHDKTKPLFLYMPFQSPHTALPSEPLQAPDRYIDRLSHIKSNGRRKYAAMVSALDDAVGNITQTLHDQGMLSNSIIIFSSDNGGKSTSSNYPLRGAKNKLWEGGTRAAAFVWSPLFKKSGYVSNHMMHVTDWLPTLFHMAAGMGHRCELENEQIDGIDMWEALSSNAEASPRKEFVYNIDPTPRKRYHPGPSHAIRVGDMKLTFGDRQSGWGSPPGLTTDDPIPEHLLRSPKLEEILIGLGRQEVTSHPVVVHCGDKPSDASYNCQVNRSPCLYNITADPCEYRNLAGSLPQTLADLQHKLQQYQDSMVEPRNQPTDSAGLPIYHDGIWGPWVTLNENDLKGWSEVPSISCSMHSSDPSISENKPEIAENGRQCKPCRLRRPCIRCRRCGQSKRCRQSRSCRSCRRCRCVNTKSKRST